MVNMITMLTTIAHIDIRDYKTPFKYLEITLLPCFGSFLYSKIRHKI